MATQSTSIRDMLTGLRRGKWFVFWDLALVAIAVLLLISDARVFLFHAIFILLTIGAFFRELRAFAARASITEVVFQLPLKPIPEGVVEL